MEKQPLIHNESTGSRAAIRRLVGRVKQSGFWRNYKFWVGSGVAVAIIIFGLLPALAAAAPGQIGYPIKRGEEWLVSNAAPLPSWRTQLKLRFANNRVTEASYIASQLNQGKSTNSAWTATTINSLLANYEDAYASLTANIVNQLNNNQKPDAYTAKAVRTEAIRAYPTLALLKLQSPNDSQLAVLTAIDDTQQSIATLSDALNEAPLSKSDLAQLAKLLPSGIVTTTEVTTLTNAPDNRRLHSLLVSGVENGALPSDISYLLDADLIKQVAPSQAAVFETVAQFEQMQRISAVLSAAQPSAADKQAVQEFLASYKAGQTVPDNAIRPYVTPIVYGIALAGQLQGHLVSLSPIHMTADDQALYDSWKGILDPVNLSDTYQALMTSAANQPGLHLDNLMRTQAELLAAQKANVAYLVMPPGWGTDQLGTLTNRLSAEIAETNFAATNPNANQELAVLSTNQKALQTSLTNLQASYGDTVTQIQTQITNSNSTPDQITQLQTSLTNLTETQNITTSDLQNQINAITTTSTTLTTQLNQLNQSQLTSLTELEIRSATNATQLTAALKTELTTQLTNIEQSSQTLITDLQTRVDALDADQNTLREELTVAISSIEADYQQVTADVQAQINAGQAATDQLTTELQTVQSSLTDHTNQLAGLASTTTALSQTVDQIQSDAAGQAQALQHQIDSLTTDQASTKTAIEHLQTQHTADIQQVADQVASLVVLQTEAQTTVSDLAAEQDQTKANLAQVTSDFNSLQAAFETAIQGQADVQAEVAAQQSALDSLRDQTESALTVLTNQQTQLSDQLSGLAASSANLNQTVTSLESTAQTTQTQLDTLLANAPWTVPNGAYVTQDQLNALSTQLNDQFAQKAAELDATLQSYQQQIDAQVQQLSAAAATTSANQTSLEQTVIGLQAQLEILQSELHEHINTHIVP